MTYPEAAQPIPPSPPEDVPPEFWELLMMIAGGVSTIAAAAVLIWKVVRPHVVEFVKKVSEVHKSVTVNGGKNYPPTLRDDIGAVGKQVEQLTDAVRATREQAEHVAEKVDLLADIVQDNRAGVRRAERRHRRVQKALGDHGISLHDEEQGDG